MAVHNRIQFVGLDFDEGTIGGAVEEILENVGQPFRYVVTPNVHDIVLMQEPGNVLKAKCVAAWRVYCDSRILSSLARICGLRLPVITGSDLTAALLARASEMNLKIAIVGPSAADCATLGRRFPGLDIALCTPPMGFIASEAEVQRCIDFVLASGAGLTFLAVGMPQQAIVAQRVADQGKVKGVGLCIGASIDFLTKKQRRAPLWVQKMRLEWLHRLSSDPRRLAKRYLVKCPKIFPLVISHLINTRLH